MVIGLVRLLLTFERSLAKLWSSGRLQLTTNVRVTQILRQPQLTAPQLTAPQLTAYSVMTQIVNRN